MLQFSQKLKVRRDSGLLSVVLAAWFIGASTQLVATPADPNSDVELSRPSAEHTLAPIVRSQAKPVELDQPVVPQAVSPIEQVSAPQSDSSAVNKSLIEVEADQRELLSVLPPVQEQLNSLDSEPVIKPFLILDTEVPSAATTRLSWFPSQSFEGLSTPTPVLIANGAQAGPVLCITAAAHGDELNGIEIVRRVLYNLEPDSLAGTVIGVPIVNLQGFRRGSRYLTDRRDLNRYFPGNPNGSSASRIAYSFFTEVVAHCDALVDIHTGSFHRTNLPQLRADISNAQVVEITQGFGSTVVLQSEGTVGTLRRAAVEAGIPAVTLEAGESMRLQEDAVKHGVKGIRSLMNKMAMTKSFSLWGDPEPVYYNSVWVRADQGGILFGAVGLGDRIDSGDLLGVVTDPISNIKQNIVSPYDGRIIGMALNQVVLPGFAAFHIGIRTPENIISEPEKIVQLDNVHKQSPALESSFERKFDSSDESEGIDDIQESTTEEIAEDVNDLPDIDQHG